MEGLREVINKPTNDWYIDTIGTKIGWAINKPTNDWYIDTIGSKIGWAIYNKALTSFEEWVAIWSPNCNGYNGLEEWMECTMEGQAEDWNGGQQTFLSGGQWSISDMTEWSGSDMTDMSGSDMTDMSGSDMNEMADKFQLTPCSGEYNKEVEKQNKAVVTCNVTATVVEWFGGQRSGFLSIQLFLENMTLDSRERRLPKQLEKTTSSGGDITEMVNILKKTDWWVCGQHQVSDNSTKDTLAVQQVANNTKDTLAVQQVANNTKETLAVQQVANNTKDTLAVQQVADCTKDTLAFQLSGAESIDTPFDWSDGQTSETNRLENVSSKNKKTAQELQDVGIKLKKEDLANLHTMSLEEFDHLLMNNNLSQEQIEKCKEVRRRGKNNVAAHNSRRRKCTQIDELAGELLKKENEKRACKVKNERLYNMKLKEAKRLNMLITKILTLSNRSPEHYTIKVMKNEAKVVRKNMVH